jgi:hypothetical protein
MKLRHRFQSLIGLPEPAWHFFAVLAGILYLVILKVI